MSCASVATSTYDEGEQVVRNFVPEVLGFLEAIDHVVAYPQGVSQTLDVCGVLFRAGVP